MKAFLAKYWFFVGIAGVVLISFRFPRVGVAIREWHLLKVGIFAAFLITGLTLETRHILTEMKNVRTLLAALISCFVLFPVVSLSLTKLLFPENPELTIGICILSVVPVTIASGIVLTNVAKGNVSLSLLICVVTNVAAIFVVPFALQLLLKFDQKIDLPVLGMIENLILVILAPTLIGQVLRICLKEAIASYRKVLSAFSLLVILLIIANAVSASAGKMTELGFRVIYIVAFMFFLHLLILLLNYGISRLIKLDHGSTAAFTIHISQKTLTVSYVVWAGFFSSYGLAIIPAVSYHLIQVIADTFVAHRFARTAEPSSGPAGSVTQ